MAASSIIPQIKKELKSFILEEKGGAQKQVLISMGAMLAGLEALNIISQMVSGANISSKHDHCDPGHSSAHGDCPGWYCCDLSTAQHSSANGVPSSHCSASAGSGHLNSCNYDLHYSANAAHSNNIVLNYG